MIPPPKILGSLTSFYSGPLLFIFFGFGLVSDFAAGHSRSVGEGARPLSAIQNPLAASLCSNLWQPSRAVLGWGMQDVPIVYLVDDEGTIATTTALILNHHAYEAIAFTEPQKALQAAEAQCPDLLITDVSMRAMNGIDLGMRFKDLYPTCKVLLFSGALSTGPLLEGARQKGFDFTILAKPVHPDDLLQALETMRRGT